MHIIRAARLSDAKKLAELAERTFRSTFAAQNTDENMDMYCQSSYGEVIQAEEISSSECESIVVEYKQDLIAYAQMRWGMPPECVSANEPGEIQRLYVDKIWHGKGLAQELMMACLDKMKKRHSDVVWLGVWEENPRAISFYRKFNFKEVGNHIFSLGQDPQKDIIMAHRMTNSKTA